MIERCRPWNPTTAGRPRVSPESFCPENGLMPAFIQCSTRLKSSDADRWKAYNTKVLARPGPMRLHQADCHLDRARLHIAKNEPDKAREHLAQAKALIEQTGYHRRDAEVEMLEEVLGEGIDKSPGGPFYSGPSGLKPPLGDVGRGLRNVSLRSSVEKYHRL